MSSSDLTMAVELQSSSANMLSVALSETDAKREFLTSFFLKFMPFINKNHGTINCGQVAVKLNQLLADLPALKSTTTVNFGIEPVAISNAGHWFFWSDNAKKTAIRSMQTDSKELIEHSILTENEVKEITDLTEETLDTVNYYADLSIDDKNEIQKLNLKKASYNNIIKRLQRLERNKDNVAFGYLIYTAKDKKGKIGKRTHTANFYVDSDDQVYFLDAQPAPVYVSNVPLPGYLNDIFFIQSNPIVPKAVNGTVMSERLDIKVKTEKIESDSEKTDKNEKTEDKVVTKFFSSKLHNITSKELDRIVAYAINKKNPIAQYYLGHCYREGIQLEKNLIAAFIWFEKSANQGFASAINSLANCYWDGEGVDKNPKKAVELFTLAYHKGDLKALVNLGNAYAIGRGVEINQQKTFECYEKAASLGFKNAYWKVGICYREGIGTVKNLDKAFEYMKKSADSGNFKAQNEMGIFYSGKYGFKRNPEEVFKYYSLSAKSGFPEGIYNMAACYGTGYGVIKDKIKSYMHLQESANKGFEQAQYLLGTIFELGDDVISKNEQQALYWYDKAFRKGFKEGSDAYKRLLAKKMREQMEQLQNTAKQNQKNQMTSQQALINPLQEPKTSISPLPITQGLASGTGIGNGTGTSGTETGLGSGTGASGTGTAIGNQNGTGGGIGQQKGTATATPQTSAAVPTKSKVVTEPKPPRKNTVRFLSQQMTEMSKMLEKMKAEQDELRKYKSNHDKEIKKLKKENALLKAAVKENNLQDETNKIKSLKRRRSPEIENDMKRDAENITVSAAAAPTACATPSATVRPLAVASSNTTAIPSAPAVKVTTDIANAIVASEIPAIEPEKGSKKPKR